MNAFLSFNGLGLWQIAGWTMIHFLWLGAIVGVVAGVGRLMLRDASTGVRYAFLLASMTLLAILPVGIAAWLVQDRGAMRVDAQSASGVAWGLAAPVRADDSNGAAPHIIELSDRAGTETSPATPDSVGVVSIVAPSNNPRRSRGPSEFASFATPFNRLETLVPYLPWLWIMGTPVTFALLAAGVVGTKRLRHASQTIVDGPIAEAFARLVATLNMSQRVSVAICDRIAAPVLIGIVRPIILLPPAALTGWSPDEIEMVLLHELAHVRRWDNFVNLLQRLVESLLFFHPAVWLVSSWIRREREACCDAVVVGRTNQPHAYAELLVALAAQMPRSVLFHPVASSAMAAGPLRSRIRRILGLQEDPMLISGKSLALALGSLVVAVTLAVIYLPTSVSASAGRGKLEAQTKNNLKNTMLALLNYESAHRAFPANAIYSPAGRPLLSWRVAILPFFDRALYDEFHLDEPWDSDHNRKLIARMPALFQNPRISESGKTNYFAVVGEECAFTGTKERLSLKHTTDGTSNTIMLVEANVDEAVEWTRPVDWKFDRDRPTQGLGELWGDHWNHARVDGSLHQVANGASPDVVGIHFTRNGREMKSLAESVGRDAQLTEGTAELVEDGPAEGSAGMSPLGIAQSEPAATLPALRREESTDLFKLEAVQAAAEPLAAPADDWPMGVVFPSPKEGEISKRAWQLLGHKITPASAEEERVHGRRLKAQVPMLGGPSLAFLQSVSGIEINSFDELADVLDKVQNEEFAVVKCLVPTSRGNTWLEIAASPTHKLIPREAYSSAGPKVAEKSHPKFPSLEVQKLADVAYKRLGLELEAIGPEELKRAQALGYDGGLKVTAGSAGGVGGGFGGGNDLIQTGDILVGLHVWPTTTMKALAEVLHRDDLPELNPLKFYVVRNEQTGPPIAENSDEATFRDIVHTGRVSVKADGKIIINTAGEQPAKSPYYYLYTPAPPTPADAVPTSSPDGTPLGWAPRAAPALADPVPAGSDWMPQAATAPSAPTSSVAPAVPAAESVRARTPTAALTPAQPATPSPKALPVPTIPHAQVPTPTIPRAQLPTPTIPRAELQSPRPGSKKFTAPQPMINPAAPIDAYSTPTPASVTGQGPEAEKTVNHKSALRYNGKSFDQWCYTWQTELSTERRTEAVKAIAAFGANGYGPEAAATLMELAGQYDWNSIGGNKAIEPLQNACVEAFRGVRAGTINDVALSLPVNDVLAEFSAIVNSGANRQQKLFLTYVLPYIETRESIELRLMLSQDEDAMVRKHALPTLPTFGCEGHDEKVSARIREVLGSGDGDEVAAAMRVIWPKKKAGAGETYPYLADLAQWIFSPHEAVRKQARNLATGLQGADATHIVEEALGVLKDESKREQHIEAIRALAALGPNAKSAVNTLRPLVTSEEQPLAIAATVALRRILKKTEYSQLLNDELGECLDFRPDDEEYKSFQRAVGFEEQKLFQ